MNVEAFSGFLDTISFDYFCTFTTRKPIGNYSARRIAEKVRDYTLAGKDCSMFWASETFDTKGGIIGGGKLRMPDEMLATGKPRGQDDSLNSLRYHFHALLKSNSLDKYDLFDWYFKRFGRCQIIDNREPARQLAASHYCSKYMIKQLADYDLYLSPGDRGLGTLPISFPKS